MGDSNQHRPVGSRSTPDRGALRDFLLGCPHRGGGRECRSVGRVLGGSLRRAAVRRHPRGQSAPFVVNFSSHDVLWDSDRCSSRRDNASSRRTGRKEHAALRDGRYREHGNVVKLPRTLHAKITGFYDSDARRFGIDSPGRVRDYLQGKSYAEQRACGIVKTREFAKADAALSAERARRHRCGLRRSVMDVESGRARSVGARCRGRADDRSHRADRVSCRGVASRVVMECCLRR